MHALDGKTLLLPLYYTPAGEFERGAQYSAVRFSTDGGATWPQHSEARIPGTEGAVGVQPCVVRVRQGEPRLIAFMRSRNIDPSTRFVQRAVR